MRKIGFILFTTVFLAACSKVEDPTFDQVFDESTAGVVPDKPAVLFNPLKNVFWGDLHIHTGLSYDAYTFGVVAMPDDAYTYAKGGTIKHALDYPVSLSRPLDFAAVTDHSEWLGTARHINGPLTNNTRLREVMFSGNPLRITYNYFKTVFFQMGSDDTRKENFGSKTDQAVSIAAWQQILDAAERHNNPGVFTTFIGYEWTSMPNENNLHRNVIYKGSIVPDLPYSSVDSENPMDLWAELDSQRERGMESIAIPHNGNVSNGLMYNNVDYNGNAFSETYAATRMRNEPISEILQVKGASETHPILSVDDEFANFEIHDLRLSADGSQSQPKGSYVRDALRTGLEFSHNEGFNPYRFGFIGSSDGHNATAPVEEDSYHGKLPMGDGSAGIRLGKTLLLPKEVNRGGMWSAMGLAAVWAEENTRGSLFDAMRRKETYATSGPRISLRFFAGWQLPADILDRSDAIAVAYAKAVPMGSDLQSSQQSNSPEFIVWAMKDPVGANLDRAQIVKVWVDDQGVSHEKVFNIAAADGRAINSEGELAAVESSVDVASATYTNAFGGPSIAVRWQDPTFKPEQSAAYYARVLEIPTPRWTTYDAMRLAVEAPQPTSLQERAISSAIWYEGI